MFLLETSCYWCYLLSWSLSIANRTIIYEYLNFGNKNIKRVLVILTQWLAIRVLPVDFNVSGQWMWWLGPMSHSVVYCLWPTSYTAAPALMLLLLLAFPGTACGLGLSRYMVHPVTQTLKFDILRYQHARWKTSRLYLWIETLHQWTWRDFRQVRGCSIDR